MKKQITKIFLTITVLSQLIFFGINLQAKDTTQDEKIKIDIVSDITCPWCAIGFKRLSNAIKELNIEDRVDISWHPFQLNPDMPIEGQNANKYLMDKLSINEAQLMKKRKNVTKLGKKAEFKFDYFADMKKLNTFPAHILLDYAKDFNKQTELKVRLQQAYFGERKNITNRDVLAQELKAVGLNAKEALTRLDDNEAIQGVKDEEKYWRDRGVYAIPTMIFNDTTVRVGANKVSYYKELLTSLLNKK